jgi:hypothetical protein
MKNKNCASGQAIIDFTEEHKPFEIEQKITLLQAGPFAKI